MSVLCCYNSAEHLWNINFCPYCSLDCISESEITTSKVWILFRLSIKTTKFSERLFRFLFSVALWLLFLSLLAPVDPKVKLSFRTSLYNSLTTTSHLLLMSRISVSQTWGDLSAGAMGRPMDPGSTKSWD